jgi:hypothetical protein
MELLCFEGCPGRAKAERTLKDALSRRGIRAELLAVEVENEEDARRLRFPGSPTIRADGRDLFPVGERGGWYLGCRVYATPEGLRDHPTVDMILGALP